MVFKNTVNIILEARKKFNFAWLIRLLSIIFVGIYIVFFYQVLFQWYEYSLEYFIRSFFLYLVIGLVCNGGLFFITTPLAKKVKVLATFLYIPTFLITPLILGSIEPYYMGIFVVFTGVAFVYYWFCPWRNN